MNLEELLKDGVAAADAVELTRAEARRRYQLDSEASSALLARAAAARTVLTDRVVTLADFIVNTSKNQGPANSAKKRFTVGTSQSTQGSAQVEVVVTLTAKKRAETEVNSRDLLVATLEQASTRRFEGVLVGSVYVPVGGGGLTQEREMAGNVTEYYRFPEQVNVSVPPTPAEIGAVERLEELATDPLTKEAFDETVNLLQEAISPTPAPNDLVVPYRT